MSEVPSTSTAIRMELVDIATEFLKNPKISNEQMQRKREFLQKKGLTDTEINYAFQFVPQQETPKQIISNHQSSFLRRFLNDLIFSGFLLFAIKKLFSSKNPSNETIKILQKTVENIQKSVVKLEQTANQLNLTIKTSNPTQSSSIEQLKQEIQGLKGLFSSRSQIPSWQSKISTTDNDNDGIIIISEQEKKKSF